tara:strand:+ start:23716 stop:24594 length:879 start_codon:yes stop_codon:yes gene_type:complete
MKILIVGSSGMLGSHLFKYYSNKKYEVYGISRTNNNPKLENNFFQVDFTKPFFKKELCKIKSIFEPEYVINVSGLTSLQECEKDPELANFLNSSVNEYLINIFSNSQLIYLSTDSVFDGNSGNYEESNKKSPLNMYAKSKSNGEDLVLDKSTDSIVIRTNIYGRRLFGNGPSIVDWAFKMFKDNKDFDGYVDYFFNPLHLSQVEKAIETIMLNNFENRLFHLGCEEQLSKYEFLKLLKKNFFPNESTINRTSNEIPKDGILRPKNTTLNYNKFKEEFGVKFTLFDGINNIIK